MGSIGERLREIRRILGLSQSDFGSALEIRQKDVSRYEIGEYSVGPEAFEKLVRAGVNVEWLLTETGYPFRLIGLRLRIVRDQRLWRPGELAARLGATKEQVLNYEDEREVPPEEWVQKVATATAADLRWLQSGWDREGNYVPRVFIPAIGAPPPAGGLAVEEPSARYSQDQESELPVSVAVHRAYMILEKAEADRHASLIPETKGMMLGHVVDYVVRGKSPEEIESLLDALIPRKPPPVP